MLLKARAIIFEGFKAAIDNGRTHSLVTDLPPNLGGEDRGPTALELAVMGLAGCVTTIYALTARKMKLNVEYIEAEVEAEKPDTEPTITKAKAVVKIKSPEPQEKLEKAFKTTLKICPVGIIFEKAGIEIDWKLLRI
jgi:putative redox protein